ncbi:MAG: CoA transferase [Gammaproteobacteria bacterium AqS3]|nr:CoA transferase [Gammaproteobacteria bacterium AqS3]
MAERRTFGALSDIRVIDLTQALAGPFGTMMLADHGADVIKIEAPSGDISRGAGPYFPDDEQKTHGGYFQSINRNKRSVGLDLKSERGRSAFMDLVEGADVVVENFRHGVMDKLGLSYETLKERNPKLVYACLRGFGDARTGSSEYIDWPAFDVVAQAMGGLMSVTGPDAETPTKVGPGIGDIAPGMFMAFGILAAVHHARNTGEGQFVDVSMVDGVLAVSERIVYQHYIGGATPHPEGSHHPFIAPFGMFPAADGHVTIAAPQDVFYRTLCRQLDAGHLLENEDEVKVGWRMANRQKVIQALGEVTAKFTKAEIKRRIGGKVPMGSVMDMADIAADPYFAARDMLPEIEAPGSRSRAPVAGTPVKLTQTPGGVHRRGPHIGEHTRAVLHEAGYSQDQIDELLALGSACQHTEGDETDV